MISVISVPISKYFVLTPFSESRMFLNTGLPVGYSEPGVFNVHIYRENQAFFRSYDWAPSPPPFPLSRQQSLPVCRHGRAY